jgi:hypothetical protein
MKNLCDGMKKVMGPTGENGNRVCWYIAIEKKYEEDTFGILDHNMIMIIT